MSREDYTIRLAAPSDAAEVEALLQESYSALMAPAYEPAVMQATLPLITRANATLLSSATYYVAENYDGRLVGCGGWTLERPPSIRSESSGTANLRHFATHSGWTRRGIGRAIISRCEQQARGQVEAVEVYSSLNGEPFYAALGFTRVREVVVKLRHGVSLPTVLMHKRF